MWLKLIGLFILFFAPTYSFALSVAQVQCNNEVSTKAFCEIQLEGVVQPGDSLMISEIQDVDSLYFENNRIGSTGYFAGRKFYAAYIPRVYPLDILVGKNSPKLSLHIEAVFSHQAKIPKNTKIKIVSELTPLRKIIVKPLAQFLQFLCLLSFSIFAFFGLKRGVNDGWSYPRHELRAFLISTFLYLLFHTEFLRSSVPWLLSKEYYEFLCQLSSAVMMWSTSRILLVGRFADKSCVERKINKNVSPIFLTFSNLALLVPLCLFTIDTSNVYSFFLLFTASLNALYVSSVNLEWRRVLKRSSTDSFLFHTSLMLLALGLPVIEIVKIFGNNAEILAKALSAFCLFTGTWKVIRNQKANIRSAEIVEDARKELGKYYKGEDRLQVLCGKIESEWGFSRVSLISVQDTQGLVLASSGPDAIPIDQRHHAKKLGPLLRRACKEGHMLYAPVAEELGKDLQEKGLKHSSLAIPLLQENKIIAVFCVMADEDERIPPYDALMIETIIQTIRLEIVSAVLQSIAEDRNERIISVAKLTGGLVLEHIDSWGRIHEPKSPQNRIVVAAHICEQHKMIEEISHASLLYPMAQNFRKELSAIWFALREQFEFLSKDIRTDDFWAISPNDFKHPTLKEIGAENIAIYLATLLEKHAKALSLREDYSALGISGAKVAAGHITLKHVSLGKEGLFGLDIEINDLVHVQKMRDASTNGKIITDLNIAKCEALKLRFEKIQNLTDGKKTYAILNHHIDLKELRKLEFLALESTKDRKKIA